MGISAAVINGDTWCLAMKEVSQYNFYFTMAGG